MVNLDPSKCFQSQLIWSLYLLLLRFLILFGVFVLVPGEKAAKPIASPIPVALYPTLSVFTLAIGLVITAIFFM